jgi:hypothetical protein
MSGFELFFFLPQLKNFSVHLRCQVELALFGRLDSYIFCDSQNGGKRKIPRI